MASVAMKWYGLATTAMLNAEHDFLTSTYKAMLTTSTFTPNQDTNDFKDDVTNEVVGTGYTAGGTTLANKTIGYTAGSNVTKLDCDDPTWTTVTLSDVKNVVVYNDTPATPATKPLLAFGIIDVAVNPNAGNLVITLDANGLLTTTAAA